MSVAIRPVIGGDAAAIRAIHLAAFPTRAEADLVERLDEAFDSEIGLVAEENDRLLGHILLSRMRVEADDRPLRALALGPVAVLPERQGEGIGARLIAAALDRARALGEEIVFVLGEPAYYQRFGFDPTQAVPFASPYAGPYFMALALRGIPDADQGRADHASAFAALGEGR